MNDATHCVDDTHVFGVGYCSLLAAYPQTPKAGVDAVRQGPVLYRSSSFSERKISPVVWSFVNFKYCGLQVTPGLQKCNFTQSPGVEDQRLG